MDEVKRKIIRDIFCPPSVVIPAAVGFTVLMAGWAWLGPLAYFAGFVCLALSGATLAMHLGFKLKDIVQNANQYVQEKQDAEKKQKLDDLAVKLYGPRLPNGESTATGFSGWSKNSIDKFAMVGYKEFQKLRTLYDGFHANVKAGLITGSAKGILSARVEEIFDSCVRQLEYSYRLRMALDSVGGKAHDDLLKQRNKVIDGVQETIDHLSQIIQQCMEMSAQADSVDLTSQREELDKTMEAIRKSESRLNGTDKPYKDEEFLKQ